MKDPAAALYLRLPPQASPRAAARVAFASAVRGRLQRAGEASLPELAALLRQAQRVILLLAASDVSLFRMTVPPLSPARLKAALPALVEDRVIGDPADCAIAVGPPGDEQRLVAVTDRAWLQSWADALRGAGARRIAALPFVLCLPLPAAQAAAAVIESDGRYELALRLSAQDGVGLPLAAAPPELPAEVLQLLATFAAERPVQLSVPASVREPFRQALADYPSPITLVEEHWSAWIEGALQVDVDLAAGVASEVDGAGWQRWRWPLALAAMLLLLNVVALNGDWWRLRSEGMALQASMESAFRRVLPDQPLVDPVTQMRERLAASRQAAGEIASGDFIALAAALGDAWAEAGAPPQAIAMLAYRDAVLQVQFKPGIEPPLEAARAALAARGLEASAVAGDASQWQVRSVQ